ncbi:MAG TPA: IclR family transcriptional regulator [Dehalococcoidales bacterium]|nr:IclR family transcriptional regulator [Dehalococcoidales bacterium]
MKKTYNIRKAILSEEKTSPGSIPRAARILACLCGNINSVTEISKESRLAKSTVHRILKLMQESALVTENPINRRYYIGPLITRLATNPVTMHEYLIRCVLDEMKYMARVSEEMVALDILFGIQIVPLHEIPSIHDIRIIDSNQKLGPLYIGAGAKVLLSQLSDEQLRIVLKYVNIPRITENTVTKKEMLIAQIEEIRKNGYAVSHGERSPGGLCIAVPIHNYTSPASLSVIGLESRLISRKETTIRELRNVSIRLSQKVREIYRLNK